MLKRAFSSVAIFHYSGLSSLGLSLLAALAVASPCLALSDETGVEEAAQAESHMLPAALREAIEKSAAPRPVKRAVVAEPSQSESVVPARESAVAASHAGSAASHGTLIAAKPHAHAREHQARENKHHEFTGLADYYHHSMYGHRTASGQTLHKHLLTAAHRTLPFGTKVKVQCKRSGRSCVVVINDRGPFTKNKVIDLSHEAARQIGLLEAGTKPVVCTVVNTDNED